jgi:hypothetical protein
MKNNKLLISISKTLSKKWFEFQDNDFGVKGRYKIVSITKDGDNYIMEVKLPLTQKFKEFFKSEVSRLVLHETYKVLITNDETIKHKLKVFGIENFNVKEI